MNEEDSLRVSEEMPPVPEVELVLTVSASTSCGPCIEMAAGDVVRAAESVWVSSAQYLFCWPVAEAGAPLHLAWVPRSALRPV